MSVEPLPPALEEDLRAYVGWNTLTRHQLIVAHMTLVRAHREVRERLAQALGTSELLGLSALVDAAIAKGKSHNDAAIEEA